MLLSSSSLQLCKIVEAQSAKAVSMALGAWLFNNSLPVFVEPKYDGRRVWVIKNGDDGIVMATKHSTTYTKHDYPTIVAELARLLQGHGKAILDAELLTKTKELAIFDIVNLDGNDLTGKRLSERKEILTELLRGEMAVSRWPVYRVEHLVAHNQPEIMTIFSNLVAAGLEGVMVKNPDSKYGATDAWLKLKKHDTLDCIVTNIEKSDGGGYSLEICAHHKGQKVSLGRVGSFVKEVDPALIKIGSVVEVQYQEITKELNLRHPRVVKIRDGDKKPEECTINVPVPRNDKEEKGLQ